MAFPLPALIANRGRQILIARAAHDGCQLIVGLRGKAAEPGEPGFDMRYSLPVSLNGRPGTQSGWSALHIALASSSGASGSGPRPLVYPSSPGAQNVSGIISA